MIDNHYSFLGYIPAARAPRFCETFIGGYLMPDTFNHYLPTLPDGLIVKHAGCLYKTEAGRLVELDAENAPEYVGSVL